MADKDDDIKLNMHYTAPGTIYNIDRAGDTTRLAGQAYTGESPVPGILAGYILALSVEEREVLFGMLRGRGVCLKCGAMVYSAACTC